MVLCIDNAGFQGSVKLGYGNLLRVCAKVGEHIVKRDRVVHPHLQTVNIGRCSDRAAIVGHVPVTIFRKAQSFQTKIGHLVKHALPDRPIKNLIGGLAGGKHERQGEGC